MFDTILCPVDGSDHARKAETIAINLAKTYGANLIFLHAMMTQASSSDLERFAEVEGLTRHVEPAIRQLKSLEGRLEYGYEEPPVGSRVYAEIGQKILDDAKLDAETAGVTEIDTILSDGGDTADQILRAAKRREADCIVMGTRGLSDMKALMLGSVSHKVVNHASCTCIAVK